MNGVRANIFVTYSLYKQLIHVYVKRHRLRFVGVAFAIMMIAIAPAIVLGDEIELIGGVDSGNSYGTAVVGDYLYVAAGIQGLLLYDISDPTIPQLISTHKPPDEATGITIIGDYAYVVDDYHRFVVFDVTTPEAPVPITIPTGSFGYGRINFITEIGEHTYLSRLGRGLYVIDNSDPVSPTILATLDTYQDVTHMTVDGEYAFLANGYEGMSILEISQSVTPTIIAELPQLHGSYPDFDLTSTTDASEVVVMGDYAYVSHGETAGYLSIIDVFDKEYPFLQSDGYYASYFEHFGAVDDYVYMAGDMFEIYDVLSSPPNVTLVDSIDGVYPRSVDVDDSQIYLSHSNGVQILNFSSPTPTPTNTPTPTSTPTPTPTATPLPTGDLFEYDDYCDQANLITTDSQAVAHTFHDAGDVDWIRFDVEEGKQYLIAGTVPLDSPANLVPQLYRSCDDAPTNYAVPFAPGFRQMLLATYTGSMYLSVFNNNASEFGDTVAYELSVTEQEIPDEPEPTTGEVKKGAIVIVAGSQLDGDVLQENIYNVTDNVYAMYREQGYVDDDIFYLAPDSAPNNSAQIDNVTSLANLEFAITEWAMERVSAERALSLYFMSHGERNAFYLNHETGETLSPEQLDQWLSDIESQVSGLKVNVIIDACHSGSFIEPQSIGDTLSKAGRVVITSAKTNQLAWASDQGAMFSDYFVTALRQKYSLKAAFDIASAAVLSAPWPQQPWLDDNGNGVPYPLDLDDGSEASLRGFRQAGTFGDFWEPWISSVEDVTIESGIATVRIRVRDDDETDDSIEDVWVQIYAPSYEPPSQEGSQLVDEDVPTIPLQAVGGGYYSASIPLLEVGAYEFVFLARDYDNLLSRPATASFENESVDIVLPVSHSESDVLNRRDGLFITFLGLSVISIISLSTVWRKKV